MPMELMFGRPAELEMLREQIESVDDITAIGDEVRGIVERNWPAPRFEVAAKGGRGRRRHPVCIGPDS